MEASILRFIYSYKHRINVIALNKWIQFILILKEKNENDAETDLTERIKETNLLVRGACVCGCVWIKFISVS